MKKNISFLVVPGIARAALAALTVLTVLVAGCSTVKVEKQKELRELFVEDKYDQAFQTVAELIPGSEERSKLLYFLERGMILHSQGKYFSSNAHLEIANEISQQLFTKSISKAALSGVANDTYDNYYGAFYERSLIHFYLALNNFLIYQSGEIEEHIPVVNPVGEKANKSIPKKILNANEKREYLSRARAQILAWDSLLSSWKEARQGKSVFKNDMLAKVFGAFIHESFQTPTDQQIATQLFKDAKDLLLKNYNAYATFNRKSVKFKKDFEEFANMDLEKVKSEYILATDFQNELQSFLDNKNNNANANVAVILQMGMIPEKVAKKYNFGLEGVVNNIEDPGSRSAAMAIGSTVLGFFAANVLGLIPDRNSDWAAPGAAIGVQVGKIAVSYAGFSFELPKVQNTPTSKMSCVEFYDKLSGAVMKEAPLAILDPLGDIAEEAIEEDSGMRYFKTGMRVGAKHLTAILASYGTYKLMVDKSGRGSGVGEFLAKNAAVLQYVALSKGIEATEKADVRYWTTLPKDIRMARVSLPKGTYGVRVKVGEGKICDLAPKGKDYNIVGPSALSKTNVNYYQLGDVTVKNDGEFKVVNLRIKKL
ncbi:MAG: hypothetical protein HQK49_03205 [Oligoflexia bacterium]|nr:hypothetical protein [Oligoflexia bacterium]